MENLYNHLTMLQIRTFELKEWEKVNEFIKEKRLIENGVQVRDECICVLYDEADHFDVKSKEVALITKLAQGEAQLLAAEIEAEFYKLAEQGKKFTPDMLAGSEKNRDMIMNLTAQIFILKKMLGRDVKGTVVFGKKQYADKN